MEQKMRRFEEDSQKFSEKRKSQTSREGICKCGVDTEIGDVLEGYNVFDKQLMSYESDLLVSVIGFT